MGIDWSQARPCKYCRALIVYAESPNGRPMPAQKVTQLYMDAGGGPLIQVKGVVGPDLAMRQGVDLYVSHFQTCPDAKRASRRG